jgi:hypothetical protein
LTAEEIMMAIAAAAAPRSANTIATMNSGDSEASGAIHCTSRNSSTPNARPVATRLSANGSAAVAIAAPESAKSATATALRGASPSLAMVSAGPSSSGSSWCPPAAARAYAK